MENINNFYSEDLPVCRFGPGGDFVFDWPKHIRQSSGQALRQGSGQAGPIAKVLKAISKMLDVVVTEELLQNSTLEKINQAINSDSNTEIKIDAGKFKSDAPTIAGIEADRQLQKEPMLFDNVCGIVAIAGHKQNNGIRAHNRLKRKRPAFSASGQGSLFEPYSQSSKVA